MSRRLSFFSLSLSILFAPILVRNLARCAIRHALALGALLATSDANATPFPVAARSAENVNLFRVICHCSRDILHGNIRDRDATRWGSCGRAVLVILFNDDAVVGNVGEFDIGIGDVLDRSFGVVHSLDANSVGRVRDGAVGNVDVGHFIVGASTDRAHRDTMAARAVTVSEADVTSRVDSKAIILVLDIRTGDVYTG